MTIGNPPPSLGQALPKVRRASLGGIIAVGKVTPPRKAGGRSSPISEENKTKVRCLFEEGFSQGNTEVVDEVLNPDFVCYDPNSESGEVRGSETIKAEIEYFRNAVSDLTYTIEDQMPEGDKVVTRYTVSGTTKGGSSMSPPPVSESRCRRLALTASKTARWWRSGPNTTC